MKLPILIRLKQINVFIGLKSQLLMSDMEASISLKAIKTSLLKDYTMLAQYLFHSKSLQDLRTMLEVSTQSTTVEKEPKMLTMQFWQLVMEKKKA